MILFKSRLHKRYFQMILSLPLPSELDSTRVTLAFFALSGLDVLNSLSLIEDKKQQYIEWFYKLLCTEKNVSGFQNFASFNNLSQYKNGHIAATYSALNTLLLLGDDLSQIDRKTIANDLRLLQREDGSFIGSLTGTENDMRFIYCAACICYILDDWSGMDVNKTVEYIMKSLSYDGGFGQGPNLESHGGSTYCAVATLSLANRLDCLNPKQREYLIRWLIKLQIDGFQGRPNKVQDTCYTFWVGASLKILDAHKFIDKDQLVNFVLSAQDFIGGGISKSSDAKPDPLHTYLSLAGLSLFQMEDVNEVIPALNITSRAYEHLKRLQQEWRDA